MRRETIAVSMSILLIFGCAHSTASVTVSAGWASKPPGPLSTSIAAFLCISNSRANAIRVVGASSPAVTAVELHEVVHDDGVVMMRKLDTVEIPANDRVCFRPDGVHLMLMGLDDSIYAGEDVPVTVALDSGESLRAILAQQELGKMPSAQH